jgi:hypothetical protein
MLLFCLLLGTSVENPETTLMARQSGAPYVFYKEENQDLIENNEEKEEVAIASEEEALKQKGLEETKSDPL